MRKKMRSPRLSQQNRGLSHANAVPEITRDLRVPALIKVLQESLAYTFNAVVTADIKYQRAATALGLRQ